MKARTFLFMTICGLSSFLLVLRADETPKSGPTPAQIREDATLKEQILARQFAQFEQELHKLILKLKRSAKEEDRLRAEVLEKVLDRSKNNLIGVKFEEIINQLKEQGLKNTGDIKMAAERSAKLADELRVLIAMMREDPRQSRLKDEIARLRDIIKELDIQIQRQKVTQGITDSGKTDPGELKKIQKQNTEGVAKLIKKMEGKGTKGDGAKGDPKDSKADPKEGKGGDKAGTGKEIAKDADKGKEKDAGKDPQVAKADPKPGEKSPSEPKPGAKSGEPKTGAKGSQGDPKSAQGEPKDGGEPKPGEAKPGESQQGQPKPGGDQAQQKPDDNQPKAQQQKPKDDIASSKKKIEDGNYNQQSAEEEIAKQKNPKAVQEQEKAIENFEAAKKKLEDLLRQLREEELERTLADLLKRCERMLAMQTAVYNSTKGVFAAVQANADKQPSRENKQDSLKLSDNEGEIVLEAKKAIEVLEAEGTAVAFPEVFQQVREDMVHVQRRLGVTDVGEATQTIEVDIIDSLKEMIEALKKAKQDLDKSKSNPPPPGGPPPDSKLLELIQELKLIRSLQIRVNTRTTTYGRMYQAKEGEQTADPGIRRYLTELSERQERIFDITNRLAKGDNK